MAEVGGQFDNRIRKGGDGGGWVRSQVAGLGWQVSGREGSGGHPWDFLFSGEAVEDRDDWERVVLGVKEAANR